MISDKALRDILSVGARTDDRGEVYRAAECNTKSPVRREWRQARLVAAVAAGASKLHWCDFDPGRHRLLLNVGRRQ